MNTPTEKQRAQAYQYPEGFLRDWYLAENSVENRARFRQVRWLGNHLVYALTEAVCPVSYLKEMGFAEELVELARLQAHMAFAVFPELRDDGL
jgi:hypothetical protein